MLCSSPVFRRRTTSSIDPPIPSRFAIGLKTCLPKAFCFRYAISRRTLTDEREAPAPAPRAGHDRDERRARLLRLLQHLAAGLRDHRGHPDLAGAAHAARPVRDHL